MPCRCQQVCDPLPPGDRHRVSRGLTVQYYIGDNTALSSKRTSPAPPIVDGGVDFGKRSSPAPPIVDGGVAFEKRSSPVPPIVDGGVDFDA